jgi:catechol 2,3-dioxygenase-like lactoylglutathione lyase family enzyme
MTQHQQASSPAPFDVQKLNHIAWKCRDAEQTRAFYEDLLGLPLAHAVIDDKVPSTGQKCDYVHIFFRLRDGSYVAFFDLGDGKATEPDPQVPGWVNHLALEVGSMEELRAAKQRLLGAGVEVLGVTDHYWLQSIYFHDPNGLRLELCYRSKGEDFMDKCAQEAHATLERWKQRAAA